MKQANAVVSTVKAPGRSPRHQRRRVHIQRQWAKQAIHISMMISPQLGCSLPLSCLLFPLRTQLITALPVSVQLLANATAPEDGCTNTYLVVHPAEHQDCAQSAQTAALGTPSPAQPAAAGCGVLEMLPGPPLQSHMPVAGRLCMAGSPSGTCMAQSIHGMLWLVPDNAGVKFTFLVSSFA